MACDPYWNKTVLACHFDGTNGSTTFTDEKGHTLTANGNAQISTAQSKFGGASAYFDGAGDYLTLAASSDFNLYQQDFTIECWAYLSGSGDRHIVGFNNTALDFWDLWVNGSGNIVFRVAGNGTGLTSTGTVTAGQWVHVAAVCKSLATTIYINGTASGTLAAGISTANGSYVLAIGANTYGGAYWNYFNGHIDDLRITKGVARYTANFTPDTSAFVTNQCTISGTIKDAAGANAKRLVRAFRRDTATLVGQTLSDATTGAYSLPVENTGEHFVLAHDTQYDEFLWDKVVLACHFDGANGSTTFVDEKGHALTANGNAQLTTTSPKFGTACATFAGGGDYVSVGTSPDFELGSSDFTIEFWIKTTQTTQYACPLGHTDGSFSGGSWSILLNGPGSGYVQFWNANYSQGVANLTSTAVNLNNGVWRHVAIVRFGTQMALYIDGTSIASTTWSGTIAASTMPLHIGRDPGYVRYFNGQLDDLRITKAARYTANFTPPTQAFGNSNATGTENAVILDRILPA